MRLLDLYSPWAIVPERLKEIQAIYNAHLRGEKIDYKAIEAKIPGGYERDERGYTVDNGIAIIPIQGPITKGRGGFFSFLFASASSEGIKSTFKNAISDSSVYGITLLIDSPGGTVSGTQELANIIYQARGIKPITAYADGMMASAAYWIGSAADKVFISGDTNLVGSIGVLAMHADESESNKRAGETITEIYAGKYKTMGSPYKPLSEDARQYLQDRVDHIYSVFVNDVARNRGVSEDKVLSDMADGRIFIGRQAIDNGLVDGVSTMDDLIESLSPSPIERLRASIQARINQIEGDTI